MIAALVFFTVGCAFIGYAASGGKILGAVAGVIFALALMLGDF